jgi:RimJ/RimL family protein N-acetyltransferase
MELAPETCLGIEVNGELASTATLLCYGRRLAWIGMVLTRTVFRGQGYARRLLMQTLTLADQMQIESVKLDATDQGQPLYEKLGFRPEQPVERWARTGVSLLPPSDADPGHETAGHWHAADRLAFGLDRSRLLDSLARRNAPLASGSSYLLGRPGRLTHYLGPCVAESPAVARALMARALSIPSPGGFSWDVLPENNAAATLAHELGFVPKRRLLRMVRGKDLRGQERSIFAIAGFELG